MRAKFSNGFAWISLVTAFVLFCVSEQTKVPGNADGTDSTKLARLKRALNRTRDESCDGFDCSQKKRADFVTDEEFYCKVGNHKVTECDAVNRMIKDDGMDKQNANYAKLSHIEIFNKVDLKLYPRPYRSLNYSVILPHHDEEGLKATMIMTVLKGKNDYYYSQNPICRVFNFSSTKFTQNDLQQPRIIDYPCIFGLDELLEQTDYSLNITVLPYQASLLYYIEIYSQDIKEKACPVNNGVAVLNLLQKLHVVFQSYPYSLHYQLTLYKDSTVLQTIEVARSKNQHEFKLQDGGQYSVGIRPIVMDVFCNETVTKSVIWRVEVEHVEDKKQHYINVVLIVLAIATIIPGIVFLVRRYSRLKMERKVDESSEQFISNQQDADETTIPYHMIKK